MHYYVLRDDKHLPGRWQLGAIRHVDNWRFLEPEPVDMEPGRYQIEVRTPGRAMGFTQTLLYGLPVLDEAARRALWGLQEIDTSDAHLVLALLDLTGAQPTDGSYFLMLVDLCVDCVDEDRSKFRKFEENDPVRPDKAGHYAAFTRLVVDPERCGGHHVFRLARCSTVLIVSEEVKRRFEASGILGAVFEQVTGGYHATA